MKYWFVIFFSLIFVVCSAQNNITEFQTLFDNQFISISCEKTLYKTENSKHFFIHYQIKNNSTNKIGILTNKYQYTFYPNQWGFEQKPYRGVIDERRMISVQLNDSVVKALQVLYKKKELTIIAPGAIVEYYRDFNHGNWYDLKLIEGEYMFVSMDGQIFFTDGQRVFDANLQDFSDSSCIFLSYPLVWKTIPANSIIFNED